MSQKSLEVAYLKFFKMVIKQFIQLRKLLEQGRTEEAEAFCEETIQGLSDLYAQTIIKK